MKRQAGKICTSLMSSAFILIISLVFFPHAVLSAGLTLNLTSDKETLWPPNHKMVDVTVTADVTTPKNDPLVELTATVTSNEPENGLGDGNTAPDWTKPEADLKTGKIQLQLRAERSGQGSGRVYTVSVTAETQSGNTITKDVEITVRHDNSVKQLLWRHSSGANAIWYMDGKKVNGYDYLSTVSDPDWTIVASYDVNEDGKPDILWHNKSTGESAIWYMNGKDLSYIDYLPTVADTSWTMVGAGDFNNDGMPDIVWRNTSSGQNVVWYMDRKDFIGYAILPTVADTNWTMVGIGDFINDVMHDIVWRNTSSGQYAGQNVIWYMNGKDWSYSKYLPTVADTSWTVVGTGDFNDDGNPDILWHNKLTGENAIWLMNGDVVTDVDGLSTINPDPDWQPVVPQ